MGFRESATALAGELGIEQVERPTGTGSIVWVCLPDDAIAATCTALDNDLPGGCALVHASGATPLPRLNRPTGVMWPLQSITHDLEPDWTSLPLIVQASHSAFAKTLYDIAGLIGDGRPTPVPDDETRARLHLGACYTQNLTNLLWRLTEEVLADSGQDARVLLPLARNHLDKLARFSAADLQTGPAARGDDATLRRHLELLEGHPEARSVYAALSALIERLTARR